MPWTDWFSWMWTRETSAGVPPQPEYVPPQPLICPACQQEVPMLRRYADGATLCHDCLEKR